MQRKEVEHLVQEKASDSQISEGAVNTLEVTVDASPEAAEACCRALDMESDAEALRRSTVEISRTEDKLRIVIEADDLTALRASMNTYLRWADMCFTLAKD